MKDNHTVLRLWKDGGSGAEYFLVENRQKTRFDTSLPGSGLLIWHIDESVPTNANEARYKVALMQADNRKDLEAANNRGDAGDPYPGTSGNSSFSNSSSPNSKSYAGQNTCVAVTGISAPGPVMTANVTVRCGVKAGKEVLNDKNITIEKPLRDKKIEKPLRDKKIEKPLIDKKIEKPITDKSAGFDKPGDGKLSEGGLVGQVAGDQVQARMAQLESIVGALLTHAGTTATAQPFIGEHLRPDLSQGALASEDDTSQDAMRNGDAAGKRSFDTKLGDA